MAVIGGVKVADKIGVIDRMTQLADALLVGGAMAFTFLVADGVSSRAPRGTRTPTGRPPPARAMADARERGCELLLPVDLVVADRFAADAATRVVGCRRDPGRLDGAGHRPADGRAVRGQASQAPAPIFWNGPMGVFELAPFAAGHRWRWPTRWPRRPACRWSAAATRWRP